MPHVICLYPQKQKREKITDVAAVKHMAYETGHFGVWQLEMVMAVSGAVSTEAPG